MDDAVIDMFLEILSVCSYCGADQEDIDRVIRRLYEYQEANRELLNSVQGDQG